MKKLMILSTVAVAALSLAACKPTQPENVSISNDTTLNTELPVDGNITEETLNTSVSDNATVADNATAIDTASNATAK